MGGKRMSKRQQSVAAVLALILLAGAASSLLADDIQGKIASINIEKNQLVVTENFKNWTFQLGKDGQVFLNDRPSRLGELQVGDNAAVSFTRQGERFLASVVRCTRK